MEETITATTDRKNSDVHSFSKPEETVVTHLDLNLDVDFNTKTFSGRATWKIDQKSNINEIIFDTHMLDIKRVTSSGRELNYVIGESKPFLGQPLTIEIDSDVSEVTIEYITSPEAPAVQWLSAEQTAGKKDPFLFTQSEAILARTWVPCQDSPGVRFTYSATVKVDTALLPVMSASNPTELNSEGVYHFKMDQRIPSYLLALAVGNLKFQPVGKRTGVYAEPETLEKAVHEFSEMEDMLSAAEELYGRYMWDRYDIIVLPPSFPFGGMENPRLTFATPTILAGDRSLVSLVAHELAHSWSGNLVTNSTWNDFWLNEGFTVYFERRIMEKLKGKEYADMLEVLGYQDLRREVRQQGEDNPGTRLKLDLKGKDPDDGMNQVAYEKGYFLLRKIEDKIGRAKWDSFLEKYFSRFSFQNMDTEHFLEYIREELFPDDKNFMDEIKRWIYKPGIPSDISVKSSSLFERVDSAFETWKSKGANSIKELSKNWSSHEWLHFIRQLPEHMSTEEMNDLDNTFGFTQSGNSEILAAWLLLAIRNQYKAADQALKNFLTTVGRRKFVIPLYKELIKTDAGKEKARAIYKIARPNYHSVTSNTVDELV